MRLPGVAHYFLNPMKKKNIVNVDSDMSKLDTLCIVLKMQNNAAVMGMTVTIPLKVKYMGII